MKFARGIWTYLTKCYKQSDRAGQMLVLKKLITWKMNTSHTIAEAGQEISYLAGRVHQLGDEVQAPRHVEVVFLNGLPKEYENAHQLPEFHAKMLDQMIESLTTAEARIKGEIESQYRMDIATESARRSKAEWLKTYKCFKCRDMWYIARSCKKP